MATESPVPALVQPRSGTEQLAAEWRRLTRVATVVAVLTAPAAFVWLHQVQGWSIGWSLLGTFLEVIAFRGLVDVVLRRFIPWPSLFGAEEALREEDVVARRRVWFWRRWFGRLMWLVVIGIVLYGINLLLEALLGADWLQSALRPLARDGLHRPDAPDADPAHRELRDLLRPLPAHGGEPDPLLRAR